MAIDFPSSPTVGQTYGYGGISYVFTAQGVWSITNISAPATSTSNITVQKFTASGTYTPTAGTQFIQVECIGGGGGGGTGTGTASSSYQGAGGGSGGYSRSVLTAAQIGTSQAITIGAAGAGGTGAAHVSGLPGGATSFGGLVIANGGGGGVASSNAGAPYGGAGAAVGTGDIAVAGTPGGGGYYNNNYTAAPVIAESGNGAPGPFGGGAVTAVAGLAGSGNGYGAGGAGASGHLALSQSGGAGAAGVVIITEYNIAAAGPQGPMGPAGGVTTPFPPQGRLTVDAAAAAVPTSSTANAGTINYAPYVGNRVPIYNGSSWVMTPIEPSGSYISGSTTDTSRNPSAIGASKCNDWFVWDGGAGFLYLSHGPDWTNDTTRSAGTALVKVEGIWLNNVTIGNGTTTGPAARRGTYVGTTRSNVTSKLDWIYPASGAGAAATAGLFGVWNAYNRVDVATVHTDTTASWTYAVATPRSINGNSKIQAAFISGLAEDVFSATMVLSAQGGASLIVETGIGYDTASAYSGTNSMIIGGVANAYSNGTGYFSTTALGYHTFFGLERCNAAVAGTFFGLNSGFQFQGRM